MINTGTTHLFISLECVNKLELELLSIPKWKWDDNSMDFVTGLLKTPKRNDEIWVVVDRLTKPTHFISIKINFLSEKLVEI